PFMFLPLLNPQMNVPSTDTNSGTLNRQSHSHAVQISQLTERTQILEQKLDKMEKLVHKLVKYIEINEKTNLVHIHGANLQITNDDLPGVGNLFIGENFEKKESSKQRYQ